jgi:hypothetical protein
MSVAGTRAMPQYSPHENTPRVGSAEGAGIDNHSARKAKRENKGKSLSLFSHEPIRAVNRRFVT